MKFIRLIPLLLSCLLLQAHFIRAGLTPLVVVALLLPFLLLIKSLWSTRFVQLSLVLGSAEWLRITFVYVGQRQDLGEPWLRLALILGAVALFTGLSALPLSPINEVQEKDAR